MRETEQRLVTMVNQIARNLAIRGDAEAVKATASHIAAYWDPRMRQTAFALLSRPEAEFSSVARSALESLSDGI